MQADKFYLIYCGLSPAPNILERKYSNITIFNVFPDTALMPETLQLNMLNLIIKLATTGFSNYALVTGDSEVFSGSLKNKIFFQFKQ